MEGKVLEFFPKYTTVIDGTVYSDPVDVLWYDQIEVEAFVASLYGTSITFALQESSDLEAWTTVTTQAVTAAATSGMLSASDTFRFVRVRITTFTPAGAALTFWVKGVARNA